MVLLLLIILSGGWGSRKLSLVAPADCGYTGRLIKTSKIGENSVIYIAPLQDELDIAPLPPPSEAFRDMRDCKKCKILYPLQILTNHIKTCSDVVVVEDGNESQDETQHEAQDVESEKKNKEQVNYLGILAFLAKYSWSKGSLQTEAKKSF